MANYIENKQITDGRYDQSLAVKCVNGTFVGTKTENIIAYKGIPDYLSFGYVSCNELNTFCQSM